MSLIRTKILDKGSVVCHTQLKTERENKMTNSICCCNKEEGIFDFDTVSKIIAQKKHIDFMVSEVESLGINKENITTIEHDPDSKQFFIDFVGKTDKDVLNFCKKFKFTLADITDHDTAQIILVGQICSTIWYAFNMSCSLETVLSVLEELIEEVYSQNT